MTVHVKQLLVRGTLQRPTSDPVSPTERGISSEDLEVWRDEIMKDVRQLIGETLRERDER